MSPDLQHTLSKPVQFDGVGIHTGAAVTCSISPAPAGCGIVFQRTDVVGRDQRVPAKGDNVRETRLGTVIGNRDGVTVATVEHLMAVFAALGIDNALVRLDGPEVPIMDGSCAPFVRLIDRVGRRCQQSPRRHIEILETIEITDGDKRASLTPAAGFELAFEIDFDDPAVGRQRVDLAMDETVFRRDLADCRTFGFLHEVEALRAAGLARGGSLDNVVVIEDGTVLNPQGLRRSDEFVRHKALDALGDLYLLGAPIIGRYEGLYAGHGLNNTLVRAVLAAPQAWRYAAAPRMFAQAV